MRRALVCLLLLATACATPPIVLTRADAPGDLRVYRLRSEAVTSVSLLRLDRIERTLIEATSRIEVLSRTGDRARIRLTLTTSRLERDGAPLTLPAPQEVELVTSPDGAIVEVTSVAGVPTSNLPASVEDLTPLLDTPLPHGRLGLGETWERALPARAAGTATQRGRIAALRVVEGYGCAIVSLGTVRPVVQERSVEGGVVRLEGNEHSIGETAFAIRERFPVRITTTSEATLAVQGISADQGSVTVTTRTVLTLVEPRADDAA